MRFNVNYKDLHLLRFHILDKSEGLTHASDSDVWNRFQTGASQKKECIYKEKYNIGVEQLQGFHSLVLKFKLGLPSVWRFPPSSHVSYMLSKFLPPPQNMLVPRQSVSVGEKA